MNYFGLMAGILTAIIGSLYLYRRLVYVINTRKIIFFPFRLTAAATETNIDDALVIRHQREIGQIPRATGLETYGTIQPDHDEGIEHSTMGKPITILLSS